MNSINNPGGPRVRRMTGAAPRRDSLLPTASPRAWFSKLLPHMERALLDRLVLASESNRAHWAECGPSPAIWTELWP